MIAMDMGVGVAGLRELGHGVLLDRMAAHVVQVLRGYALRSLRDLSLRLARDGEAVRVRAMLGRATPPPAMAAAPVAPARGPMRLVDGLYWRGMDQLSVMCRQACLAWQASGGDEPFVPPFTPGQIAVAVLYAGLVERHDGAGIKCASLEARGGGGSGGGFADAYLAEGREIAAMRARIGDGIAMSVRRVRPSDRGTRAGITDRALVDMVCLGGMDLTAVLRRHGWVKSSGNLRALRLALAGALDRMVGCHGASTK